VGKDLTRVVYFRSIRIKSGLGRLYERAAFKLWREWLYLYNFSDMDYDAMRSVRVQYPEYLSPTDSHMVSQRKLITEHARGLQRPVQVAQTTTAERLVVEGHELLGVGRQELGFGLGGGAGDGQKGRSEERSGRTP
jgi:hypothetical protein